MRETWYVLEDGSNADPAEVAPDPKGVLRHSNGVAVKMRNADTPLSRSVDPDEERAKAKAKKPATKDATAEKPAAGYSTRETKAR